MASLPCSWQHLWCCSTDADITLMLVSAEPVPTARQCAKASATEDAHIQGAADEKTAHNSNGAAGSKRPAGTTAGSGDAAANAGGNGDCTTTETGDASCDGDAATCMVVQQQEGLEGTAAGSAGNGIAAAGNGSTSAAAAVASDSAAAGTGGAAAAGDAGALPAAKRPRLEPEPEACLHGPVAGTIKQAEVLHLGPAHKKVLTAVSDFIRARFESCAELDPAEGPWGPTLKLLVPRAEWDYAMDVLRFAYGLPLTATTVKGLVQVLLLANEWQLPTCIDACLKKISDMQPQQLSHPDVDMLLNPAQHLAGGIWENHNLMKDIKAACGRWLVHHFGCIAAVLNTETVFQAIGNLSLAAILLWAAQSAVQADSENSVVAVIHVWWLAQTNEGSTVSAGWDEQSVAEQLTAAVRLKGLSLSYLSMIESLPWFRPSQQAMQAFRFMHSLYAKTPLASWTDLPTLAACMPPCWRANRAYTGKQGVTISWDMFESMFDKLHAKAATGTATARSSKYFYFGYYWSLVLELASQSSGLRLHLEVASALPNQCLPPALGMSFTYPSKLNANMLGYGMHLLDPPPAYMELGRDREMVSEHRMDVAAVSIGTGHQKKRIFMPITFQVWPSKAPRTHSRPPDQLWNPYSFLGRRLTLQVCLTGVQ